jgi:hypothetical protein
VFGLEDLAAAEWVWVRLWLRRGRLKGTARIDSGGCSVCGCAFRFSWFWSSLD